jgi:hypothetical protein
VQGHGGRLLHCAPLGPQERLVQLRQGRQRQRARDPGCPAGQRRLAGLRMHGAVVTGLEPGAEQPVQLRQVRGLAAGRTFFQSDWSSSPNASGVASNIFLDPLFATQRRLGECCFNYASPFLEYDAFLGEGGNRGNHILGFGGFPDTVASPPLARCSDFPCGGAEGRPCLTAALPEDGRRAILASAPVRCQKSAAGLVLGFHAARSYSLERPPCRARLLDQALVRAENPVHGADQQSCCPSVRP